MGGGGGELSRPPTHNYFCFDGGDGVNDFFFKSIYYNQHTVFSKKELE